MPRFRARRSEAHNSDAGGVLSLDEVRKVIAEAFRPGHFFVGKTLTPEWHYSPSEETVWEIYQGRLLDASHTRLRQLFESWSLFSLEAGSRSGEPILSLKLDARSRQLHVTRAILSYVWEGYDAGENVYLSRETRKWVRELVGTVHLDRFADPEDLRDEVICLLFQAVVGCSRLPLTSVEAPLPAFSLGDLAYFYQPRLEVKQVTSGSLRSFRDLIERGLHENLAWLEKAKLLEIVLRGTPPEEISAAAELFMARWHALRHSNHEFTRLCRTLFNEIALSPYTDFMEKTLALLKELESSGHLSAEAYADFLSYMLRQNARHLTAYDLITFHHRGANYPDALLLDAVLKAYLAFVESHPGLFGPSADDDAQRQKHKRIRRRALRQAWLLRRMYEGLPVPDAPTSPGENSRVLPPPHARVPEEQIFQPNKRTKRLFEEEPLSLAGERCRELMRHCVADLRHTEELQELGMAVFLDRPFGIFKAPTEPDQTVLLSYEAFSLSVAERRLQYLAREPAFDLSEDPFVPKLLFGNEDGRSLTGVREQGGHDLHSHRQVKGIAIKAAKKTQKPGAVALPDAARVADDFLVLRTTRQAVQDFLDQFDLSALAGRFSMDYFDARKRVLIMSAVSSKDGPEGILDVYDANLLQRLELQIDPALGYRSRAGHEYPAAGLRVVRVWEPAGASGALQEHVLEGGGIVIPPRDRSP